MKYLIILLVFITYGCTRDQSDNSVSKNTNKIDEYILVSETISDKKCILIDPNWTFPRGEFNQFDNEEKTAQCILIFNHKNKRYKYCFLTGSSYRNNGPAFDCTISVLNPVGSDPYLKFRIRLSNKSGMAEGSCSYGCVEE